MVLMRSSSPGDTPYSLDHPPRRILVLRFGAVGDLVRTLPAVELMHRTWPEAKIAWAIEEHTLPLLADHPLVDQWIVYDRDQFVRDLRRLRPGFVRCARRWTKEVRAFDPDLTIDFQGCLKTGVANGLSRAAVRASFSRAFVREWSHVFANHRVDLCPTKQHRVLRALELVRSVGAQGENPKADLGLTATELARGKELFTSIASGRDVVAIAPFSSLRQAWKRYPLDRWKAIAKGLVDDGYTVLVLAGPGEQQEADELKAVADHIVCSSRTSLRELAALLGECRLLIGGDTGPMHMAWGVETPVVALFGPTDPVLNAPYGEGHVSLAPSERTHRTDADKFPGITPDKVLAIARELLARNAPKPELVTVEKPVTLIG